MTAAVLLALVACGSNDQSSAGAAGDSALADAPGGDAAGRRADESVAAVLQSQGTPLAALRFTLPERPVAGQAFTMQLSASAAQPLESLQLRVESTDLVVTPDTAELVLDAAQTPVVQDFTLTAAGEGLTELTVRMSGDGSRPETVYAIPVLVLATP